MRFLANGPCLPDELLVARDEGRALFFCGAGVSLAKAGLPDFLGLARAVVRELRALPESPAQKLIDTAASLDRIPGVGGILAADRIFGLLERDFSIVDIARATGAALKPKKNVDLSAHKTLLKLSRDLKGKVQLVTTNFDLLFEKASPRLPVFTPIGLPDLSKGDGFSGIVHLHGMVDPTYSRPVGGNLVLSSAEFGRAYLAEGWATSFIRAAISRHVVVFVGYAADDPPVAYLLEALNRVSGSASRRLYAFQAGRQDEATALWAQKGVQPIAYPPDNNHIALWNTLDAWAERARNPDLWRKKLIQRARHGPERLQPHERGQVAHLARTEAGTRAISQTQTTLPATWLCVFDPSVRFGRPRVLDPTKPNGPELDPFTAFGLDSDPQPSLVAESNTPRRREIPPGVVDVFAPTLVDVQTLPAHFHGNSNTHTSSLSPRLMSLAEWLGRVCGEPAAVWWAAGQTSLHPTVIQRIQLELDYRGPNIDLRARRAWRYLFDAWRAPPEADFYVSEFALKEAIGKDGWTPPLTRRFADVSRPVLAPSRPFWGDFPTSARRKWPQIDKLVNLEVRYPERHARIEIPDDILLTVVAILRKNLEHAVDLEREVSPFSRPRVAPIQPDPKLAGRSSERDFGINIFVFEFVELFHRLVLHDKQAALREFAAWRSQDDPVFGLLRVWAAGLEGFVDNETAGEIFATLDDGIFWGSRDQRDLLLALRQRWRSLSPARRKEIERRLLNGPPSLRRAPASHNRQRKAYHVLDRVTWLRDQGCDFDHRVDAPLARFRQEVPQWEPRHAAAAADSNEARGGYVVTDTSIDELSDVPISELIPRAMQGQKRVWGELREHDPYAGLCERRPVRLLAALRSTLRGGTDVTEPWTKFLQSGARWKDKPKIAALIARRLTALPQSAFERIALAASYWIGNAHSQLHKCDRSAFDALFDRTTDTLSRVQPPPPVTSASSEGRDWTNAALGSAAGHLAAALFADPALAELQPRDSPSARWLNMGERLLSLPGDHGRFGLVSFARYLGWLYQHASAWSEQHIVCKMLRESPEQSAAVSGFLTNPEVFDEQLYRELKPLLIDIATVERQARHRDTQALGQFFVSGWLSHDQTGARLLIDDEFRRALLYAGDEFRTHILWHVERFQEYPEKIRFLANVWPLQMIARTPAVVSRLSALPFSDKEHFGELVAAVLPLVSNTEGGRLTLPLVHDKDREVSQKYPEEVLSLLNAVLPDDVSRWPYGVDTTLEQLLKAKPGLAIDSRFVRLTNLWESR